MRDISTMYVWHTCHVCVTYHASERNISTCMCDTSMICESCHTPERDVYESCHASERDAPCDYVRYLRHVNESCHLRTSHVTYECVTAYVYMSYVIYERVMCHTYTPRVTRIRQRFASMPHVTYE